LYINSDGANFVSGSAASGVRKAACLLALLPIIGLSGCRQDMHNQPKFIPQRSTTFYADGRSVRPQVPGTVARNQGDAGSYFLTGMIDGKEGDGMPFPVTIEVMQRGQERYNIYCTPCHSRVGNGIGMIVERGYYPAASFHSTRLRDAPLGHFFDVITNGHGAMPNYAAEITPQDRWAIVAYIRALQLSQQAQPEDAPTGQTVERLQDLSKREGFAPDFVAQWTLPNVAAPTPHKAPDVPNPSSSPALTTATTTATTTTATASPTNGAAAPGSAPATAGNAAAKPAAAPAQAGDATAGHVVYTTNCERCHQSTRTGAPPFIPSLVGIITRTSEDHVRTVLSTGFPNSTPPMPNFSDVLSETDIENLLAFLKTTPAPPK
jgi:mono/diheme cytochrome c family protein